MRRIARRMPRRCRLDRRPRRAFRCQAASASRPGVAGGCRPSRSGSARSTGSDLADRDRCRRRAPRPGSPPAPSPRSPPRSRAAVRRARQPLGLRRCRDRSMRKATSASNPVGALAIVVDVGEAALARRPRHRRPRAVAATPSETRPMLMIPASARLCSSPASAMPFELASFHSHEHGRSRHRWRRAARHIGHGAPQGRSGHCRRTRTPTRR